MYRLMTILFTTTLLSLGCAEQATDLNGGAALDFVEMDTGTFDTGDTGFGSAPDQEDNSGAIGRPGGTFQHKPIDFDLDDLETHCLSEEPLDELCAI